MRSLSQSETRAAILFFRSARKHKLVRGHWDLASCQVSLNSIQRLQRRSLKCLNQSEAETAILCFGSARKTQTWLRTLRSSFLLSFWILLRGFRGEVENASANQRPGMSSCFSIDPKTINLVGGVEILLPVKLRWILFSGFRGEIKNCPCQSETRAAILGVPIGPKKNKLGGSRWDLV